MWKGEIPNAIVNLGVSNSCQDTNALSKVIKKNGDIFTDFPYFLKLAFKAQFKARVLELTFSRKAKRTQNRITSQ